MKSFAILVYGSLAFVGVGLCLEWLAAHISVWGRCMQSIILPPATDKSWLRAKAIVSAFRAHGKSNAFIVGALANAYAESAFKPVIAGDHGQSFGPWQCKFSFYGEPILFATNVDIRTETDLARHVDAILFVLSMPANKATLAALDVAKTGEEATRIWCAGFERASAENAVARRVAIAPAIEVWLSRQT